MSVPGCSVTIPKVAASRAKEPEASKLICPLWIRLMFRVRIAEGNGSSGKFYSMLTKVKI
ncbi:hypothetical protein D3C76_1735460 [compost metagenome]